MSQESVSSTEEGALRPVETSGKEIMVTADTGKNVSDSNNESNTGTPHPSSSLPSQKENEADNNDNNGDIGSADVQMSGSNSDGVGTSTVGSAPETSTGSKSVSWVKSNDTVEIKSFTGYRIPLSCWVRKDRMEQQQQQQQQQREQQQEQQ